MYNLKSIQLIINAYTAACVVFQITYSVCSDTYTFFELGPSSNLISVGIKIDTWSKWNVFLLFVIVTQIVKVLADETISPWIINTVMDHKCYNITEYTPSEVHILCQSYYAFSGLVSFIKVVICTTQVDFVLCLILTDCIVSFFTTRHFLKDKTFIFTSPI